MLPLNNYVSSFFFLTILILTTVVNGNHHLVDHSQFSAASHNYALQRAEFNFADNYLTLPELDQASKRVFIAIIYSGRRDKWQYMLHNQLNAYE